MFSLHINLVSNGIDKVQPEEQEFATLNEAVEAYKEFIKPYYRTSTTLKGNSYVLDKSTGFDACNFPENFDKMDFQKR